MMHPGPRVQQPHAVAFGQQHTNPQFCHYYHHQLLVVEQQHGQQPPRNSLQPRQALSGHYPETTLADNVTSRQWGEKVKRKNIVDGDAIRHAATAIHSIDHRVLDKDNVSKQAHETRSSADNNQVSLRSCATITITTSFSSSTGTTTSKGLFKQLHTRTVLESIAHLSGSQSGQCMGNQSGQYTYRHVAIITGDQDVYELPSLQEWLELKAKLAPPGQAQRYPGLFDILVANLKLDITDHMFGGGAAGASISSGILVYGPQKKACIPQENFMAVMEAEYASQIKPTRCKHKFAARMVEKYHVNGDKIVKPHFEQLLWQIDDAAAQQSGP
jgi:hypothetical protein